MGSSELAITADLYEALRRVLGEDPTAREPIVVVAACLDALAKGYGLSESLQIDQDPLERADLPAPAKAVLSLYCAAGGSDIGAAALRDRLYHLFAELAEDRDARRQLNSNRPLSEVELLTVGQVYWNLEATRGREKLPIRPGPITTVAPTGGRQAKADIPVPGANKDFAVMTWTARVNQKSRVKSSGQGFRTQGARLAVLAAQDLVRKSRRPRPDLDGVVIHQAPAGRSGPRTFVISWPEEEPIAETPVVALEGNAESSEGIPAMVAHTPGDAQPARSGTVRVLVGAPAEVGADYQWRGSDTEIEELWARGGDRRIWVRGGPGLGKSYTARRLMQEAVANTGADRDALLIWVPSADADAVIEALAAAVDRLRLQGFPVPGSTQDSSERKTRSLLGLLAVSTWRWLIVLDNVDARSVIEARLVPPGGNPNGRVLLTTLGQDPRIASHGHVVTAQLFTSEEAEAYLRSDVHFAGRAPGPLSRAPEAQSRKLAQTVGHHPLALSIAASTISANAMTLPEWIDEFTAAETMDAAADEPDRGGYPHLLGATWQVVLVKASEGLPQGLVQRAAIVAALQDPDGHPTWLWDRDAVAGWVAGGAALARHHRVPVALQRLVDSGLIELRGTWRGGQVALHQLAARAVREGTVAAGLTDIAVILLEQWLLQLTANPQAAQPDTLRRNLRPIAALPDLPAPARRMAAALLAYAKPTETFVDRSMAARLEPYLAVGGVIVRIMLGEQWIEIGDEEAALGRTAQARASYQRAADLYRPLVDDPALNDDELASCLIHLGDLEDHLGNPAQAQAIRFRARKVLERLGDTTSYSDKFIGHLADLVTVHDHLGNQDQKEQALRRAERLVTKASEELTSNTDISFAALGGGSWRTLAGLMEQSGRLDLARACHIRELAVHERSDDLLAIRRWAEAMKALALLHARGGEWADAERLLACLTDIAQTPWAASDDSRAVWEAEDFHVDALVLLASVQTHLGRHEEAEQVLARAADHHPDPRVGDNPVQGEPPDDELRRIHELGDRQEKMFSGSLLGAMAFVSASRGRLEDAVALSASHIDLIRQIADEAPGEPDAEAWLADAYRNMGDLLFQQKVWDQAAEYYSRAASIDEMLAQLDSSRADAQQKLSRSLEFQGLAHYFGNEHQAAAETLTRAVGAFRRVTELAPDDQELAARLADLLSYLAMAQKRLGNYDVAVSCFEQSISIRRRLADQATDDLEPSLELAHTLEGLAAAHFLLGNHDVALGCYEQLISILSRLVDQAPDDQTAQIALAEAWMNAAGIWVAQERWEDAVEPLRRSADTYASVDRNVGSEDYAIRTSIAWSHAILGYVLTRAGHRGEGMIHLREALSAQRALADLAPDDLEAQSNLALTMAELADNYAETGQREEAVSYLTLSINILQLLTDLVPGERPDLLIRLLGDLAEHLRDLGRAHEADDALARARDLEDKYPEGGGREGG